MQRAAGARAHRQAAVDVREQVRVPAADARGAAGGRRDGRRRLPHGKQRALEGGAGAWRHDAIDEWRRVGRGSGGRERELKNVS